jgi:hypothetical protein
LLPKNSHAPSSLAQSDVPFRPALRGIDRSTQDAENALMKTIDQTELDADTQAVIEHAMTGKPLDPAIARRVRAEGEKVRQEIFAKHGLVDIAVPAIRELRGELPDG